MMKLRMSFGVAYICLAMFVALTTQASAQMPKRFIVYKNTQKSALFSISSQKDLSLNSLNSKNSHANQKQIVDFDTDPNWRSEIAKLQIDPEVEHIEEDMLMQAFSITNDDFIDSQWALDELQADVVWSNFPGDSNIVVAVIDTGITNHSELSANVLPGADFISDSTMANDGGGRDNDPSDPGDWVSSNDRCYQGLLKSSSWHGTHVAGIVAAKKNNGQGVAGLYDKVKILPVRVLGKCGGYTSDIADGVRWAAGLSVTGMPINQNPAKVINLSLGAPGACGRTMQSAVDAATLAGSVVVVAAGNDTVNLDSQSYSPANCEGVITVGAISNTGSIPSYSNYGSSVDVYAPGGDSANGVYSTVNGGWTTPSSTEDYLTLYGTSMAAPYVSATIAIMMTVNSNLYPLQYKQILKDGSDYSNKWHQSVSSYTTLNTYEAVSLSQSAQRDDSFKYVPGEPIISGGLGLFKPTEEGGGVGCASIAFINKSGPGPDDDHGGPGNSAGDQKLSFLLGLLIAGLMTLLSQKRKSFYKKSF